MATSINHIKTWQKKLYNNYIEDLKNNRCIDIKYIAMMNHKLYSKANSFTNHYVNMPI